MNQMNYGVYDENILPTFCVYLENAFTARPVYPAANAGASGGAACLAGQPYQAGPRVPGEGQRLLHRQCRFYATERRCQAPIERRARVKSQPTQITSPAYPPPHPDRQLYQPGAALRFAGAQGAGLADQRYPGAVGTGAGLARSIVYRL